MDPGSARWLDVRGVAVPTLLYGTAWKEEATARLVGEALEAGFAGIDTANQRKHYFEAGVGCAVAAFRAGPAGGAMPFLQTKFTYVRGQDHRLPYDPAASPGEQVRQSLASSLAHLGVGGVDSYLLHGPASDHGLTAEDVEVWRTFEALHDEGRVRLIGVSNIRVDQLEALLRLARVAPAFVQNRLYFRASPYGEAMDRRVRALCRASGIVYQGFSILTANREVWGHRALHPIARRLGCTPAQVMLRYAMDNGVLPLTGTTDPAHMRADLAIADLRLTPEEHAVIGTLCG